MNYEEMSDNEINEQVADLMGGYAGNVHGSETMVKVKDAATNGMFYMEVDYCNNPSDAWPIIDKHNICIHNDEMEGRSYACSFDKFGYVSKESYCDKTLRAAMIVFLMMQE